MNIALTLKRLGRRWYILVPGLLLAVALAIGAWHVTPPKYERTATQVLLPGTSSLPTNANPYYYLGGLSQAADVLVRAVGSDNVLSNIQNDHPGVAVEVARDPSTSGPVIRIVVTALSDAEAAAVVDLLVEKTASELDALQDANAAARSDRITVVPISVDDRSTVRARGQLVTTVAVAGLLSALTILVAALVEGLSSRATKRRERLDEDERPNESERLSRPAVGLRPLPSSAGRQSPTQLGRHAAPRKQVTAGRPTPEPGVADVQ